MKKKQGFTCSQSATPLEDLLAIINHFHHSLVVVGACSVPDLVAAALALLSEKRNSRIDPAWLLHGIEKNSDESS
jgi:molybdopterin-guanine dinucleotide biosynthesis protein A